MERETVREWVLRLGAYPPPHGDRVREAAEWFRAARMDGRAPGDNKPPVFPGFHCPMPPDVAARGLDILSRWTEPPKPLPFTQYDDLSQWYPGV